MKSRQSSVIGGCKIWIAQLLHYLTHACTHECMEYFAHVVDTQGWRNRGGARGVRPPILDFRANNRLLCSLSRQPSQSYFCSATTVDTFMSLWWLPSFQVLKIRGCTTLASFPGLPGSSFWSLAVCRNRGMFTNQMEQTHAVQPGKCTLFVGCYP